MSVNDRVPDSHATAKRRRQIIGVVAVIAIAAGSWAAGKYWPGSGNGPPDLASAEQLKMIADTDKLPRAVPEKSLKDLPAEQQLNLAMAAVFGDGPPEMHLDAETSFTYDDGQLLWEPFGAILILRGSGDPTPVGSGTVGIVYLAEENSKLVERRRWKDAVAGSMMGNPPDYTISRELGAYPVIISTTGGVWQGYSCGRTQLTALRREGPVMIAQFGSTYSNTGAADNGDERQSITGEVVNIRKNVSFDVEYTGTSRFTHKYIRDGNSYIRAHRKGGGEQELPTC